MIKCPNCGSDNLDNAIFCSICGINILNYERKRVLLVEPIATSNFLLTKAFKKSGFDVKSLKTSTFVFDELSNTKYHFFIIDLDLSNNSSMEFLKRFRKIYPKQSTIIITPSVTKEDLSALKSLEFNTILVKPVKAETILNHIKEKDMPENQSGLKYSIYDKNNVDKIVIKYIKDNDITYIISFLLKDFSKKNILSDSMQKILDKVYNSIKRSDKFLVIENVGFFIIPTEHITDKGINIFKNKIQNLIGNDILKSCGILRYPYGNLSLSDICSMAVNGDFAQDKKEAEVQKPEIAVDYASIEELFNDKHLVFSALSHLTDHEVASLYFNEKLKSVITPFITLSQAKIIKKITKTKEIVDSEAKFISTLKEIAHINNHRKNDGIEERIKSDISLMTLPEIQNNIIMLINEDASFKRIVSELQKDAAISSKVLKLVNSAFFGFAKQIKSLERAASILGTEEILGLSLSISYVNSFDKNISFIKKLWQENIAIMSTIKFIENKYKLSISSTSSILSSIGKIFFAQYFPEQYVDTIKGAQEINGIYDAVELKYFSSPHTVVGANIIDMWNLPENIKTSAMYHTYPAIYPKEGLELYLIHAAKYIVGSLGYSTTPQSIDDANYHTCRILSKKYGVDIVGIYEENKDNLKQYIEDMMFLVS